MSFGDTWQKAADEKIEPPRGTYQTRIVDGGAFTSKAGDDYCKIDLEITEGDHKGSRFEHFMGFKHEVGARINREALLAYGLEDADGIRSIEDLDDRIAKLKGRTAEVGVSYKDGYMQVKVTGSRTADQDQPDISGQKQPDFATAASSNGGDDDTPPF